MTKAILTEDSRKALKKYHYNNIILLLLLLKCRPTSKKLHLLANKRGPHITAIT